MSFKSVVNAIFGLLSDMAEQRKAKLDEYREKYRYASLEDLYRKYERTSSSREKIMIATLINERERRMSASREDE